ncbi:Ribose ABC transport system, ATP-binding protein RbsA (TC 3.A.1.2.1) [Actinomycetales bacterium JB111]|nr:Ribose ABC transport system, ATP-binding protein RbsA (TC 3.A.1.2.1) [Actinomycetales bacterium JB111]
MQLDRSTESTPVLQMTGIAKRFGGVHALKGVDLEVRAGEVMALLGENGAGKSTLMNILAGVVTPDAGTIVVGGEERHFHGPSDSQAAGVAMIHQELDLVPGTSVADNIFLGAEKRRFGLLDRRATERETRELLAEVGIRIPPSRLVGSMRVGEQQMVAIAKALRLNARILVMDEPTSALSETEVARLFEIIPGLRRRGVAIIFISHRMDEIAQIADRGTVMRDGANVGSFDVATTAPGEVIRLMIGKPLDQVYPDREKPSDEVRLRLRGLALASGPDAARSEPRGIDLVAHRGEVVGLAGLLGAGRSELLDAIFGLGGRRLRGQIEIDGQPVRITSPRHALAAGIGYVPEDRRAAGLNMFGTVGNNIAIGVLRKLATLGWRSRSKERRAVAGAIETLHIKTHSQDTIVRTLSGGNQQKVVFGRYLLREPRVLLLDEPTRGVDVGAKSEIYRLLARLSAEGVTVLMASSELPELIGACDRIVVLNEGAVVTEMPAAEASEEKLLAAAGMERGEPVMAGSPSINHEHGEHA